MEYNHTTNERERVAEIILYLKDLLLSAPAHVREGCGGNSSRLSRHTSRSATTSNISRGWSPKRFHPRSL